eukprot:TRINITY_DN1839_c0_g1_i1.p1 TRINITY_DN1839_c0_g1~~TRINITY_DN1839_c0_g1_i1.p1  ORF type:complete len:277 (-),score=77.82 TRINITY_DN1839_c0_g1_i1:150-980(-)
MGIAGITSFNDLTLAMSRFRWVHGATPFSSAWWPFLGSVGYLLLIFGLRRLKKKEGITFIFGNGIDFSQKSDTKRLFALHSTFLVALSAMIFAGTWVGVMSSFLHGADSYDLFCDPNRKLVRGVAVFWSYVFYLSKYYKFVDTVLIVLAKRPVELAHLCHRLLALWLTWAALAAELSGQWLPLLVNTLVHTLTYYYQLRSSQGYVISWKPLLAQLRMLQFGIGLGVLALWLPMHLSEPHGCSGNLWAWLFCVIGNVASFLLFAVFRKKSLKEKKGL